uniref:RING-type E3 ubiquitin transferase n=1 Tax=Gallus gallus TaxID=9031 RepID=A0A8V0YC85_CHICK
LEEEVLETMAAAEAWTCPVCREARRDVAYATPCNHQFCLGCIQRWAMLKTSCPLCRTSFCLRPHIKYTTQLTDTTNKTALLKYIY